MPAILASASPAARPMEGSFLFTAGGAAACTYISCTELAAIFPLLDSALVTRREADRGVCIHVTSVLLSAASQTSRAASPVPAAPGLSSALPWEISSLCPAPSPPATPSPPPSALLAFQPFLSTEEEWNMEEREERSDGEAREERRTSAARSVRSEKEECVLSRRWRFQAAFLPARFHPAPPPKPMQPAMAGVSVPDVAPSNSADSLSDRAVFPPSSVRGNGWLMERLCSFPKKGFMLLLRGKEELTSGVAQRGPDGSSQGPPAAVLTACKAGEGEWSGLLHCDEDESWSLGTRLSGGQIQSIQW